MCYYLNVHFQVQRVKICLKAYSRATIIVELLENPTTYFIFIHENWACIVRSLQEDIPCIKCACAVIRISVSGVTVYYIKLYILLIVHLDITSGM